MIEGLYINTGNIAPLPEIVSSVLINIFGSLDGRNNVNHKNTKTS